MSEQKDRSIPGDIEMIYRAEKEASNDIHSKSVEAMAIANSGTPMLEDEEMPTYISVSTSSKCEDSDISNAKHRGEESPAKEQSQSPCNSEQDGPASIYVLSSEEETAPNYEEYYRDYGDRDYGDSDDMDDIENDHDNGIMDDEDEDEAENVQEYGYNDDEYDDNWLETASDCLGIKNKLKKKCKDKSLSLQDLTIFQNNANDQDIGKRNRYKHIESKVKNYINDIKEQNKFSSQRRLQDQVFTGERLMGRNSADGRDFNAEQAKDVKINKVIKEYAERAIKNLEIEETYTSKTIYMAPINENGEAEDDDDDDDDDDEEEDDDDDDEEGDDDDDDDDEEEEEELISKNNRSRSMEENEYLGPVKKNDKRNDSAQIEMLSRNYGQSSAQKNLKFTDEQSAVNGNRQELSLFNLRTLSYDEYMQDDTNIARDAQLNKNMNIEQNDDNDVQVYSDVDVINSMEADNSNAVCSLKIENVKSIRTMSDESKDNTEFTQEKLNEDDDNGKIKLETMQITLLKSQLDQKTTEFNNLKDAYQNALEENSKMKQELEELKISLSKYEKENRNCETKVVAVQTEVVKESSSIENNEVADVKLNSNKLSGSSITSATSSINQWTDSAGSSGISMKPPDLGTVLNSEDSLILTDDTPRKKNRPLSRTFVTSSRILQTLSNITQGKTRSDIRPTIISDKRQNGSDENDTVKDNDGSIIAGSSTFAMKSPLNAKKRKATEMLGNSTFLQPMKIPHTAEMTEKSSNEDASDFDTAEVKPPDNDNNEAVKLEEENNKTNDATTSDSPTNVDNKNDDKTEEEADNQESNVKCYVYQEDENVDDRSILIQAEVPTNGQESTTMNSIRECGPYLLGNVEVRMSEVNGTINIWGKEISETSIAEGGEDLDVSTKSPCVNKKCSCMQNSINTPQRQFNCSQMVCSTNKKVKLPSKCNDGHHSSQQYLNVPERSDGKLYMDDLLSPSTSGPCEKCALVNQQKECPAHKRQINLYEKSHSCCLHNVDHLERDYNKYVCDCERLKRNNDSHNCVDERYCKEKKFPFRHSPNCRKDLYEYINPTADAKELMCKHHNNSRRSSMHNIEVNIQNDMKCFNALRDDASQPCKSSLGCMGNNNDGGVEHFCNHNSMDNNDEQLIPEKSSGETPEVRQRRSSGKRVRGILMDLLKSCGDYRNGGTSSTKRYSNGKEPSTSVNCSPQNNVSSYNSQDPGCSNVQQSNGRCCHAYTRRIESQLEEFRLEMERVRSRSDAILNLLNMLHSVEMN